MKDKILRKLFLGFIQIHILHHADNDPFYGSWMMDELAQHGYHISPGTMYPLLHRMEADGLLKKFEKLEKGKIRKYYEITGFGKEILIKAREKAYELFNEIK